MQLSLDGWSGGIGTDDSLPLVLGFLHIDRGRTVVAAADIQYVSAARVRPRSVLHTDVGPGTPQPKAGAGSHHLLSMNAGSDEIGDDDDVSLTPAG